MSGDGFKDVKVVTTAATSDARHEVVGMPSDLKRCNSSTLVVGTVRTSLQRSCNQRVSCVQWLG